MYANVLLQEENRHKQQQWRTDDGSNQTFCACCQEGSQTSIECYSISNVWVIADLFLLWPFAFCEKINRRASPATAMWVDFGWNWAISTFDLYFESVHYHESKYRRNCHSSASGNGINTNNIQPNTEMTFFCLSVCVCEVYITDSNVFFSPFNSLQ